MTKGQDVHTQAARRHQQAAANHDRAAAFWDQRGQREQAVLQRELAGYERQGAELEIKWAELMESQPVQPTLTAAESAKSSTRRNAEHLSLELDRTAQALEKTAVIAQEHARRKEQDGQSDGAADELKVAERALSYAARARSQSEEWRRLATRTSR